MIKVGICGASGYMGGEVLRVLLEHPETEAVWATSRHDKYVSDFHRNFYGLNMKLCKMEEITPCDVVFLALPSGHAMELSQKFLEEGTKVIDLGSDFRLENISDWEEIYGMKHTQPELIKEAIYGLTEFKRDKIKNAKLIANPGCYSSSAIFGLAPLVNEGIIDTNKIVVDGLSGTAGAGAELNISVHHPEIGNNILPYNVVNHRHTYEIEQELSRFTQNKVSVHFSTAYVPITRGILTISHCFPNKTVTRKEILDLYKRFYNDSKGFIKILDYEKNEKSSYIYEPYPWVSAVSGTNYCHIGVDVDEKRNRIVVYSVLDSIGKGGAHAGVQNLNVMFGLDENTGLSRSEMHPY